MHGEFLFVQRTVSCFGAVAVVVEIIVYLDVVATQCIVIRKSIPERNFFSCPIYLAVERRCAVAGFDERLVQVFPVPVLLAASGKEEAEQVKLRWRNFIKIKIGMYCLQNNIGMKFLGYHRIK